MTNVQDFNATEFCSRKLWEIVSSEPEETTSQADLKAAVDELAARRHYLSELEQLGVFNPRGN